METLQLPEDVRDHLMQEAHRRGLAVETMAVVALREWMADRQSAEVVAELLRHDGIHRGVPPADRHAEWQPRMLAGRPLSEVVVEERGAR